ncbi:fimbrial protein [Pantoea agglomerans]|uniref:fimbrial protein n=1 Tax=Enterobacter agglomerans TaxID=549 RepID=UPI0013D2D627|nr:fimbrial protein [Pantoea agglomerans]NEG60091.1 type 1 fimbrial protein [Pantoea agglomerans]
MPLKLLSCLFLLSYLGGSAFAASHGHGHLKVKGSIVDTACAIATDDADQSIDLGSIAASELITEGHSPSVPFTIHLMNCVLNSSDIHGSHHWKDVHITFDGVPDGSHLFALHGNGKGEAVGITDAAGAVAEPGKQMAAMTIEPGSMALNYRMYVTGNHHVLQPGNFYTSIRYFMEYD